MAKGEKDTGSKSAAVPGGVKASDLPASVGGTKGADSPAPPASVPEAPSGHAPVTTDAADNTPPAPVHAGHGTGPAVDTVPNPFADEAAAGAPPVHGEKLPSGFREAEADGPAPAREGVKLRDYTENTREFARSVKSGHWSRAFQTAAACMHTFAALMDGPGMRGATSEDAEAAAGKGKIESELHDARNYLSTNVAGGGRKQWAGDPHPTSGSPMPIGSPKGADATAIDPQTLLVLWELVMKLWEQFKRW